MCSVHLGTDLFNHSKGLFFNRALDKFSECPYNIPFMLKNGRKFQKKKIKKKEVNKKRKKGRGRWGGGGGGGGGEDT